MKYSWWEDDPRGGIPIEKLFGWIYKYKHSFCPRESVCLKPVWFSSFGEVGC